MMFRPGVIAWGAVNLPSSLGWSLATYPFTMQKSSDTSYTATVDAQSFTPGPFGVSATIYWVDVTGGSNSNNGLTEGAAKKSINAAITAGNATLGPFKINVKGGNYDRNDNINGNVGSVVPTQPCAIVGYSGRVVNMTHGDLTYAVHDAPSHTYSVARSSVGRVFDRLNTDANGNLAELTQVADAATCVSTAGSWALVSNTTLYVHRADGAVVSNTNTRVFLSTNGANFPSTSKDIYLEGIDFQGGTTLAVSGATRNAVLVDCTAKYSGSALSPINGFAFAQISGLILVKSCIAAANSNDGFNYHASGGEPLFKLSIDCEAYDNGRFSSTSNNGDTMHEATVGIDVNGYYHHTINGSDVHTINTSKTAYFGTRVTATDAVDVSASAIRTGNSAEMWLEGVTVSGVGRALYASGTASKIHKHNVVVSAGTETADSGCTIDLF